MLVVYAVVIVFLSVYSYVLVDPNLTLVNHPAWVAIREFAVQVGYYHRDISWYIYLSLVVLLFIFYRYILHHSKSFHPFKVALGIGAILFFSYPFLSHDFFNYIFDAKILTFYGQNPYTHKPSDFGADEWLRFMHWTHRTYPYGPFFLVTTLVPSFLAMGKFVLNFFFFKALFVGSYLVSVYFLQKVDKKTALLFAIHPFILIEGLINGHNDLIAVSLGIVGICYLLSDKRVTSLVFLILSAAIKYMTFPLISVHKDPKHVLNIGALIMQTTVIGYLTLFREIQPWYFLTYFAFLPLYPRIIGYMNIFLFGLLMSYYPFIRLGEWSAERVELKHTIILSFFILNVIYVLYKEQKSIRVFFSREVLLYIKKIIRS